MLCTGVAERPDAALYFGPDTCETAAGSRGLRTHRYTYVSRRVHEAQSPPRSLLFDNTSDPYQMTNIADDEPQLVETLHKRLTAWLQEIGDPRGTEGRMPA